MPPRKRARASTASTPLRETQAKTPVETTSQPAGDEKPGKDVDAPMVDAATVDDPWTDEQETQLLRGLMKWKPAGVHKHFHMIRLSSQFADPFSTYNVGATTLYPAKPSRELTAAPHTRIPGIWAKLSTLYNLPGLDEREDARTFPEIDFDTFTSAEGDDPVADEDAGDEEMEDAGLPDGVFGRFLRSRDKGWTGFHLEDAGDDEIKERMWERRFEDAAQGSQASGRRSVRGRARSESPPVLGWELQRAMPSVFDTSSAAKKAARRSATPAVNVKGAAKTKTAAAGRSRRGARAAARSQSVEEERDEADADEEQGSEDEDEEEGEETGSSPAGRGSRRGRGPASKPAAATRKSTRKR